jgi:hypothetical protein
MRPTPSRPNLDKTNKRLIGTNAILRNRSRIDQISHNSVKLAHLAFVEAKYRFTALDTGVSVLRACNYAQPCAHTLDRL